MSEDAINLSFFYCIVATIAVQMFLISYYKGQAERYRRAIIRHRRYRADDRCWLDDQELYKVLGDGNLGDFHVGDKQAMLRNCERFLESRCMEGRWKSYEQMERERNHYRDRCSLLEKELGREDVDGEEVPA